MKLMQHRDEKEGNSLRAFQYLCQIQMW